MDQRFRNIISILLLTVYAGYQVLFYLHLNQHKHSGHDKINYSYKFSTYISPVEVHDNDNSNLDKQLHSIKHTETVSRIIADCNLCNLHYNQNVILPRQYAIYHNPRFDSANSVYFYNLYHYYQNYTQLRAPPTSA